MSNLERTPDEVVCPAPGAATATAVAPPLQIIEAREVPLGGPRAMTVRRTLPHRERTTIGAWCFADHYGPDPVSATGGMVVPPHPHTGLQTVSWLFRGEIEHRDSTGAHALVRPGEVNLMTAGRGISHSEVSTPEAEVLHGVQLWVALPEGSRSGEPFFEASTVTPRPVGDAVVHVFMGGLAGHEPDTDLRLFSPLLGAQIDLPGEAGGRLELPAEASFEHGVLVDAGEVRVEGRTVAPGDLAYLAPGRTSLLIEAEGPARLVLLGGEPLGEQLVMWWNFIGRDHDEIAAYRAQWQGEVVEGADPDGRFGTVAGYEGRPLPAPVLPLGRLKPRP